MADEAILRDRTYLTRLLVLRSFHGPGRPTLRAIARDLGVTVQAVSVYARGLADDGLLEAQNGTFALTPRGLAEAQEGFARLKRAVDEAFSPLAIIDATSAVAATRVAAGDEVGLFMEGGELVARAGAASGSRGRAVAAAEPGDEVVVRDLAGVVALKPGRVLVVKLPAPAEGGSARVPLRKVKPLLAREGMDAGRLGVHGTGAKVLASKAGLRIDFEFGSVEAAFNAAERGLDVALLVTGDLLRDALALLDARNAQTLRRVAIDIAELAPEGPAPDLARRPGEGRKRR